MLSWVAEGTPMAKKKKDDAKAKAKKTPAKKPAPAKAPAKKRGTAAKAPPAEAPAVSVTTSADATPTASAPRSLESVFVGEVIQPLRRAIDASLVCLLDGDLGWRHTGAMPLALNLAHGWVAPEWRPALALLVRRHGVLELALALHDKLTGRLVEAAQGTWGQMSQTPAFTKVAMESSELLHWPVATCAELVINRRGVLPADHPLRRWWTKHGAELGAVVHPVPLDAARFSLVAHDRTLLSLLKDLEATYSQV